MRAGLEELAVALVVVLGAQHDAVHPRPWLPAEREVRDAVRCVQHGVPAQQTFCVAWLVGGRQGEWSSWAWRTAKWTLVGRTRARRHCLTSTGGVRCAKVQHDAEACRNGERKARLVEGLW